MRTIDESIVEEREKAKEQRSHIGTWDEEYSKRCDENAEEHEQLVAWLEELKAYRTLDKTNFSDGYNKAIDDFVKACKENIMYKTFGLRECDIEQIAEQLKAGEHNG